MSAGRQDTGARHADASEVPAASAPADEPLSDAPSQAFLLLSEGFTLKGQNRWQPPRDGRPRPAGEPPISPQLQVGPIASICMFYLLLALGCFVARRPIRVSGFLGF